MGKLSLKLLNPIHRNRTSQQGCLVNSLRCGCRYTQQNGGFTLIELIVVMVIIGVLAAIATPSWVAFVNRQKVNKANDAVLAALQEGQREAKNKKLSYTVSFQKNTTTQNIEVAVYSTNPGSPTWKPLGADVGVSSNKLLLGANLNGENTISTTNSTVSYPPSSTPTKITFDYMGALPTLPTPYFGTGTEPPGLKIVVAVPSSTNSTSASGVKRCVIVKTLLGSMLTAKDDKCT